MFHVGQFVTCLDGGQYGMPYADWPCPKTGHVYEISDVSLCSDGCHTFLRLVEFPIFNDMRRGIYGVDVKFKADYYRPVARHNVAIIDALKALPPLDELDPPTPDERPMQ